MDYAPLLPTFGPALGRQIHAAWIGAFGREPRTIIVDACEDAPGFEIEEISIYRMGDRWAVGVPHAQRTTRDEPDIEFDSEHGDSRDAILRVVELIARREAHHALTTPLPVGEWGDLPF